MKHLIFKTKLKFVTHLHPAETVWDTRGGRCDDGQTTPRRGGKLQGTTDATKYWIRRDFLLV